MLIRGMKTLQSSNCQRASGFSLVELMVALAIGGFLLMGVVTAYVGIKGLVKDSENLQASQDVIRFSMQVFSRSIKNASTSPIIDAGTLTVTHSYSEGQSPIVTCQGRTATNAVTETFSFASPDILCDDGLGAGAIPVITNVSALTFTLLDLNGNGVDDTVLVQIDTPGMPDNYPDGIAIRYAMHALILGGGA